MAVSSVVHAPAGVRLADADTVRKHALGTIAHGDYGGMFVYCSFGTTIPVGAAVTIDKDFVAAAAAAASVLGARVGVLRTDGAISGTWGWAQVAGQASILMAASVSANVALSTSGTANTTRGASGATGERNLSRIILNAASGAGGLTEATLNFPEIGATI